MPTLIVECNALPMLVLILRSEDTGVHYEAVGVIGNPVHSSKMFFIFNLVIKIFLYTNSFLNNFIICIFLLSCI